MKAISKTRAGFGAAWVDCRTPSIGPGDLLLRVHRASICGSDLPIYQWTSWAPQRLKLPMVFGHELCGTVVGAGKSAGDFKLGDFVSVESHIYCGKCRQCLQNQKQVCQDLKIIGLDSPGGFSEYARIPARCAWKFADAALKPYGSLLEPLGNAVYTVLAEEVAGRSVLVLGCGPQGLFAIAVAKASGAAPVIAVESPPYRRKLAEKAGADAVLSPQESRLLSKIRKKAKYAGGVDVVLELSGSPQAIALGFESLRSGGRLSAFGIPPRKLEVDWARHVIFKGVRISGIVGREVFGTWKQMMKLIRGGAIPFEVIVTHTFPMKDFERGFEVMMDPERRCGKVLLAP